MNPYLSLLRPKQWVKNIFVMAPLLFSHQFLSLPAWTHAILATLIFCLAASAVYVFNDWHDQAEDRHHPDKRKRPFASGLLHTPAAFYLIALLVSLALVGVYFLSVNCLYVLLLYWFINILYTLKLKQILIIDVMTIAFSFVLRVLMGAYAIAVIASPWIILCTFVLALFLGFGKRRQDIEIEVYRLHRKSLQRYSPELLDKLVVISATCALIFYVLYTVETSMQWGHPFFILTSLFVAFGLFRYLWGIYYNAPPLAPEIFFFKDKPFLVNFLLWIASIAFLFSGLF